MTNETNDTPPKSTSPNPVDRLLDDIEGHVRMFRRWSPLFRDLIQPAPADTDDSPYDDPRSPRTPPSPTPTSSPGGGGLPTLRAGIYKHWKGHLYNVLGYAHDANDPARKVVVYVPLYMEVGQKGPRMAVRTVEDFFDQVCRTSGISQSKCNTSVWTDAGPEHVHDLVPRFAYQGPEVTE